MCKRGQPDARCRAACAVAEHELSRNVHGLQIDNLFEGRAGLDEEIAIDGGQRDHGWAEFKAVPKVMRRTKRVAVSASPFHDCDFKTLVAKPKCGGHSGDACAVHGCCATHDCAVSDSDFQMIKVRIGMSCAQ